MSAPDILDIRSDMWRRAFANASDYDTYLNTSDAEKAERWHEQMKITPDVSPAQAARLMAIDNRELNVLVYSGVWCGDCVRQGPILHKIAQACPEKVTLRVIDRDADEKLSQELRILGGRRVPVVVFLSEDFFEVGRFGDRLLSAYRDKAATGLGASCPTGLVSPPAEALAAEMADWVDVFEQMLLMVRLSGFLRQRHGD